MKSKKCLYFNLLVGVTERVTISDSKTLGSISAYMAENKLKAALKAKVKCMVIEAKENEIHIEGPRIDSKP